jgi:hypothetical protein
LPKSASFAPAGQGRIAAGRVLPGQPRGHVNQ